MRRRQWRRSNERRWRPVTHDSPRDSDRASTRFSRRSLLKRSAFLALAAPAGGALFDACGSSGGSPTTVASYPIASPGNPVTWPIHSDNRPIASGLKPEQGATLNLYNYADYIDPKALKSFETMYKSTGVKVVVS